MGGPKEDQVIDVSSHVVVVVIEMLEWCICKVELLVSMVLYHPI
jgi:hypothetical protein